VVAYGALDAGDPRRVDGDTLFEIGSISKTFIALALQDMALKGEVALDDPVAKYLPPDVKVPSRNGKPITLRQLATHTSGLPRDLPLNLKHPQNLMADLSEADLYRFLAGYELTRDPGAEWEYSNLGVGLLGIALSRRAGVDLETLIRQRVTGPLGMLTTTTGVTPAIKARLAVGHDAYLRPVEPFEIGPAEAAAGALRSSANEMLDLLAAELGYRKTPLAPAMAAMLKETRPGMRGGFRQALGWMMLDLPSGRIVTHSGGTFGQRAFAAFNPKTREGVVVLSNAEGAAGPDEIGLWIISGVPVRPLPPAPPPPGTRQAKAELPIGPEAAQPYLGRYRMSPNIFVVLAYADGHLTCRTEAKGRLGATMPVAWHGGADFSAANGGEGADITFQLDPSGRASALTWRGPAGEFLLRRVADAPPA
jgi:CubicO group peptidase (beta-lactamase class C family)